MYKIEQNVVFETRLQVMVMVLFIRLTMRLGICCRNLSQQPQKPEQDLSTRQGDPFEQESPGREGPTVNSSKHPGKAPRENSI